MLLAAQLISERNRTSHRAASPRDSSGAEQKSGMSGLAGFAKRISRERKDSVGGRRWKFCAWILCEKILRNKVLHKSRIYLKKKINITWYEAVKDEFTHTYNSYIEGRKGLVEIGSSRGHLDF